MHKKLFALLCLTLGLYVLDACCGDKKPFFDYNKLTITSSLLLLTASQDTVVTLRVAPDDLEYLASEYRLTVSTPAYGTNCPQPGEDGTKYKMTSIDITANKDFNDTLPAGASLASIFYNGRATGTPQSVAQDISELEFPDPSWDFLVFTPNKPAQIDQTFDLTVKITKSDGSVAVGKVNNVRFK